MNTKIERWSKVLSKNKVFWISEDGFWFRIPMNGKITKTRIGEIDKLYGFYNLEIEVDSVFGNRILGETLIKN